MRTLHRSLALLALLASPLAAQTQAVPASITATILASLSLSKTSDMTFPPSLASAGLVSSNLTAIWTGATEAGNAVSVSFSLPTVLTKSGGATIPFTCGATSAALLGMGADNFFNPNTGIPSATQGAAGTFTVQLSKPQGNNTGAADRCEVDLTGKLKGSYTGTVTLTVVVL
jgi:hypothetical protein